jgi:hypothetical protein
MRHYLRRLLIQLACWLLFFAILTLVLRFVRASPELTEQFRALPACLIGTIGCFPIDDQLVVAPPKPTVAGTDDGEG